MKFRRLLAAIMSALMVASCMSFASAQDELPAEDIAEEAVEAVVEAEEEEADLAEGEEGTTAETVTITFNRRNGAKNATITTADFEVGAKVTFPANPTYVYHTFKGWSEAIGGTVIDTSSITATEAKTYYGVWEYTHTGKILGELNAKNNANKLNGEGATASGPYYDAVNNKIFKRFLTATSGKSGSCNMYSGLNYSIAGTEFYMTALVRTNMVGYAGTAGVYQLTNKNGGGINSSMTQTNKITEDQADKWVKVILKSNTIPEFGVGIHIDYDVTGAHPATNVGTDYYDVVGMALFNTLAEAEAYSFASVEASNYNVYFDLNYEGADVLDAAPATTPTREGYEFKGWSTNKNMAVGEVTDLTCIALPTADTTYYAIWEDVNAAASTKIYLDQTNGNDENNGRSKEKAVKTIKTAQALLASEGMDTLIIVGQFLLPDDDANNKLGYPEKTITITGYDSDAVFAVDNDISGNNKWNDERFMLGGPLVFENIKLMGDDNDGRIETNSYKFTFGEGISTATKPVNENNTIAVASQTAAAGRPAEFEIKSGTINKIHTGKFNGHATNNIASATFAGIVNILINGENAKVNSISPSHGYNQYSSQYGIVNVTVNAGTVDTIAATNTGVVSVNNYDGLKYYTVNGGSVGTINWVGQKSKTATISNVSTTKSATLHSGVTVVEINGGTVGSIVKSESDIDDSVRVAIFNNGKYASGIVADDDAIVIDVKDGALKAVTTEAFASTATADEIKAWSATVAVTGYSFTTDKNAVIINGKIYAVSDFATLAEEGTTGVIPADKFTAGVNTVVFTNKNLDAGISTVKLIVNGKTTENDYIVGEAVAFPEVAVPAPTKDAYYTFKAWNDGTNDIDPATYTAPEGGATITLFLDEYAMPEYAYKNYDASDFGQVNGVTGVFTKENATIDGVEAVKITPSTGGNADTTAINIEGSGKYPSNFSTGVNGTTLDPTIYEYAVYRYYYVPGTNTEDRNLFVWYQKHPWQDTTLVAADGFITKMEAGKWTYAVDKMDRADGKTPDLSIQFHIRPMNEVKASVLAANGEYVYVDSMYLFKSEPTVATVTFKDEEGTVLYVVDALNSEAVTFSGTAPEKDGFDFVGWAIEGTTEAVSALTFAEDTTLVPVYEAGACIVKWMNGTEEVKTESLEIGEMPTAPELTKLGYTLSWDKEITAVTESVTYTAVWTAKEYDVVFNAGEGTFGESNTCTVKVAFDSAISAPANPTREGYVFFGWDKAVGTLTTEGVTFNATWELSHIAAYREAGYEVYYASASGSGKKDGTSADNAIAGFGAAVSSKCGNGKKVVVAIVDDVTNPNFAPKGTLVVTSAGGKYLFKTASASITYAENTEVIFDNISILSDGEERGFNANGVNVTFTETVVIGLIEGSTKTGAVHINAANDWSGADCVGNTITIRTPYNIYPRGAGYSGSKITGDVHYVLEANANVKTLHAAGKTGTAANCVFNGNAIITLNDNAKIGTLAAKTNQSKIVGNFIINVNDNAEITTLDAYSGGVSGYVLVNAKSGKIDNLKGGSTWADTILVQDTDNAVVTTKSDLYSDIRYNGNGGSVTVNDDYATLSVVPAAGTKYVKITIGTDVKTYNVNGDEVTLLADLTAIPLEQGTTTVEFLTDGTETKKITFVSDGETVSEALVAVGTVPAVPTLTKTGYTLSWDKEIVAVTEAVTYTAVWTANTYTITYKVNGEVVKTDTYAFGAEVTAHEYTAPTGYTFSGWDKTIPTTMPAENLEFTGTTTVNNYTITYKVNGEVVKTDTYAFGAEVTAHEYTAPTGYTFSGWNTTVPTKMPAEDLEITGTTTANTYTVTYYVDGEVYTTETYAYGADVTMKPAPEKAGYTFSGWDKTITTMPAENVTVNGTFTKDEEPIAESATYKTYGTYDVKTETYTFEIRLSGVQAHVGSFGFAFPDYMTFVKAEGGEGTVLLPEESSDVAQTSPIFAKGNGVYANTWTAEETEDGFIDASEKEVLIATLTFTMAKENRAEFEAWLNTNGKFAEYAVANADAKFYNGENYLVATVTNDLSTPKAPVVYASHSHMVVDEIETTLTLTVNLIDDRGEKGVSHATLKVDDGEAVVIETEFGGEIVYTIEGLEAEKAYKLLVEKNGYAYGECTVTLVEGANTLTMTLVPGDIKGSTTATCGDGIVDIDDFVRLIRAFDPTATSEFKQFVDIDENGEVNVTDLGFIKTNFGKTKADTVIVFNGETVSE